VQADLLLVRAAIQPRTDRRLVRERKVRHERANVLRHRVRFGVRAEVISD
jgi:hypothetical protein